MNVLQMQGGEIWLLPAHRPARILGVLLRPDASGALGWMVWGGDPSKSPEILQSFKHD